MLDMEQSSSITARFSTKPCDFCRTNVDRHCRFIDKRVRTAGLLRGDTIQCRGTEVVLVVESPPAYDAIVTTEVLPG